MQDFFIEEGAGGGGRQGSLLDKFLYLQIIVTECCRREMTARNLTSPPPGFEGNAGYRVSDVYVIKKDPSTYSVM